MSLDRTRTDLIVVHGTSLPTVEEIHRVHLNKGVRSDRGRTGYHYIIEPDGKAYEGRELQEIGAHARGYNDRSIGICLTGRRAGNPPYTQAALNELENTILYCIQWYKDRRLTIVGHDAFSNNDCPGIDIDAWASEQGYV